MNSFQAIITIGLLVTATTGLVVYITNSRRAANRFFFFLSFVLTGWFACLGAGSMAATPERMAFWIRQSSLVAALIPSAFALLLLSIVHRNDPFLRTFVRARRWLLCYAPIAVLCQTDFFLQSAHAPLPPRIVPVPEYGPGFLLYAGYFLGTFFVLATRFLRFFRTLTGMDRTELQFMLLGACAGMGTGITFLLLPVLTDNSDAVQFLPFSALVLNTVLAYGIATRRVMDVSVMLRRATAYALLAAYLTLLYLGVWFLATYAFGRVWPNPDPIARVLATVAVALSLVPANGLLQRVANRLFVNVQELDAKATLQRAHEILTSIGTLDSVLGDFSRLVAKAMGTDRIVVLLGDQQDFVQAYPPVHDAPLRLEARDGIIEVLQQHHEPLVPDFVQRVERSQRINDAAKRLQAMSIAAAVGIYSKSRLDGMLLLGPRLSGRIYAAAEQETLDLLCRQLAVALENAKLYTQLQDSKIYHEILLDNLVSGVAAATADGRISVFNREAQRITRLSAADVMGRPIRVLPEPLARTLELTLERQLGVRDQEMIISRETDEDTPVRVGSSVFHGHRGRLLGALVVFHDVDALRRLEMQVRRTDRLASVGTLAAGMAHEIKNPLVTVKTFTQLLPERYDDPDFRDTFSSLIGQEVKRIDTIVSQLLGFSRPAKPKLAPGSLHEVLDASLNLVAQQLRQNGIRLERNYGADTDLVQLDADQLNQAFINLLLNAIEAMSGGGCLTVETRLARPDTYRAAWQNGDALPRIRVTIRDTGEGIPHENLARIFDPFFTTKTQGTGLGLSVAHGIIQEHGGTIDVESEASQGTSFLITFPLAGKEAAV